MSETTTGDALAGVNAALALLESRPHHRIVLTADGIDQRTLAAPPAGTRLCAEVIADHLGLMVVAHGRDDLRPLAWLEVPYPRSRIEAGMFARYLAGIVDIALLVIATGAGMP
jgi:hypothetical protein